MAHLRIQLLGSPQVTIDDTPISVDTRKAIALLAYLAITQKEHRRSTLTVLLWPESDQKRGRTALRRTLAALNKAIGKEWIEADRSTIGLRLELLEKGRLWIDVHALRERLTAVSHADENRSLALLQEAADLYNGRFMEGFGLSDSPGYDDWQFFEREQVNQEMMAVWSQLIECYVKQNAFDTAIPLARQWLSLDPLFEQPQLQLMQLYAWAGQRNAALRQYEEYVALLEEELGIEPQPETTAVYEQIRQNALLAPEPRDSMAAQPAPEQKTAVLPDPPPRHNLPLIATPFVGRQEEKRVIENRLAEPNCRLFTIIGPGGVGKTRLALEIASDALRQYQHGVFFIPLADISTASHIPTLIADVVGFTFYGSGGGQTQLLTFLRDKTMLLILDNFEHILDGASFVVELLRQAPHLKLLVTSQERLNLREEFLYEIEAFRCVDEARYRQSSAYQLFVQRAQQVNSRYSPSEAETPCLADICRFVGGLPLGIELASSWVRLFSPCDIVQEMQTSLDFLTSSLQDVPDRQRSLRAVFEYSWQLLTDQEQETFARLSLFRGSFNIPAALKITQVSLSSLITLADKSLLRQGQNGRYEIPAVLREYGRSRLAALQNQSQLEERFATYYLDAVTALESSLKGRHQKEAVQQIRIDLENVRQAWRLGVAHKRLDSLSAVLPALLLFFEMRSAVHEGETLFAQAVDALTEDTHLRLLGRLRIVQGACLIRRGQQEAGREMVQQGMEACQPFQDIPMLGLGNFYLGISYDTAGELDAATKHLKASWELFQNEKGRWGMANALNALGNVYLRQEAFEEARQVYQESLMIRRHIGDQRGIAISFHNMGNVPVSIGNYPEARQYFEKSLEINRELNDKRGIGHALNNIGYTAFLSGEYGVAEQHLQEGLVYLTEIGEQLGIAHLRQNLGHVALARGEWRAAEQLYEQSLALFQAIGDRYNIEEVQADLEKVQQQKMGKRP